MEIYGQHQQYDDDREIEQLNNKIHSKNRDNDFISQLHSVAKMFMDPRPFSDNYFEHEYMNNSNMHLSTHVHTHSESSCMMQGKPYS
jgi:hypothetical protein